MRELATHQKILIEAQDLIQRFGFHGLSLQDLADRIKIRKPSLYAHYDSKENLGTSAIQDYERKFRKWTERLQTETPQTKFKEFYLLLEGYLKDGKVSPNGALSLEGARLPESMRLAQLHFVETQVQWIEQTIRQGQERRYFQSTRDARNLARLTLQKVVGAELMSRMTGDMDWFHCGCEEILRTLLQANETSFVAVAPELNN